MLINARQHWRLNFYFALICVPTFCWVTSVLAADQHRVIGVVAGYVVGWRGTKLLCRRVSFSPVAAMPLFSKLYRTRIFAMT